MGQESGYDDYCEGRTLPLVQETVDQPVWTDWGATWRDVMIVDAEGTVVSIYNLTEHDLAEAEHIAELEALVAAAAGG